ncbi:hypothetical protein BpHYR1_014416 [Brachionus plicatilis]|uniref:Uncharacterized protein n=1 Tax=Brachionus plicatilis TaxID=10195 RepID=A0A3M7Q956_BRAPC|nr:hypothetical protein BpHYR1_014416 [Brachionus plicatilis]
MSQNQRICDRFLCYGIDSLTKCGLPVSFFTTDSKTKYSNCKQGSKFLECINASSAKLCSSETNDAFMAKLKNTIELYDQSFDQNCREYNLSDLKTSRGLFTANNAPSLTTVKYEPKKQLRIKNKYLFNIKNIDGRLKLSKENLLTVTSEPSLSLDNDCPQDSKCEPKSLHITCGYPAANPKNNLNAYCNELRHYIQCAKCKIQNLLTKSVYHSERIEPSEKLENLFINFDSIDIVENRVEVLTSGRLKYWAKIENKTDILRGIRNGAIYLHSKTSLSLDLMEQSQDLCVTSLKDARDKFDQSCVNGWTVSFWFKVSYLNLFDKTILKVDNFIDNKVTDFSKYLLIKISNWEVRVEFLYRRKFWSIAQKFVWRPEWTMLSMTWSEFEGLSVFINGNRLFSQQLFEYYSSSDIYGAMKSNNFEDILEDEKLVNYLAKRSFNLTQNLGVINIGLTNKISQNTRKFFFSYRDRIAAQNSSQTAVYSESILLDQMFILNKKIGSREIYNLYVKEYTISTEFDSVEEKMYLLTLDNKQQEIVECGGAMVKKSASTDNWYFSLNGPRQFFFLPNLFDACIIDAQNLCSFGFSVLIWFKVAYNFKMFKLESVFEQSLFYLGSTDFQSGLEAVLYVRPGRDNTFSYTISLAYASKQTKVIKHFQVLLADIGELNSLNCLVAEFSEPKDLNLVWLGHKVVQIEWPMTQLDKQLTYFDYHLDDLKQLNFRSSHLTGHSIGLIGDLHKESFFHVHKLKIKHEPQNLDQVEQEFDSQNPIDIDFDSFEKLSSMGALEVRGQPTLVDSKYGKSMLLINDQKLVFNNVSDKCLGNLAMCKNGYTLKMVFCFTNYAARNFTEPKKIFLISNTAQSNDTNYNFFVFYDFSQQALVVDLKLPNRLYHSQIGLKVKYFMWYSLHITWEQRDGLRVYVNTRLLDHTIGSFYHNSKVSVQPISFIIGRSDADLDDPNEFIVNRFVQYNVRKYPDEIMQKSLSASELMSKRSGLSLVSSTFFWYMLSCVFLSMCLLFLVVLALIMIKRKAYNGYWSRETDGALVKKSKMCCHAGAGSMEDVIQQHAGIDLELKNCKLNDRLSVHFSLDDFQTNSLYGTIDRLIVKKPVGLTSNPSPTVMYTNNYNSLTKDPKMRASPSYVNNTNQADIEKKSEIHF